MAMINAKQQESGGQEKNKFDSVDKNQGH